METFLYRKETFPFQRNFSLPKGKIALRKEIVLPKQARFPFPKAMFLPEEETFVLKQGIFLRKQERVLRRRKEFLPGDKTFPPQGKASWPKRRPVAGCVAQRVPGTGKRVAHRAIGSRQRLRPLLSARLVCGPIETAGLLAFTGLRLSPCCTSAPALRSCRIGSGPFPAFPATPGCRQSAGEQYRRNASFPPGT